MHVRVNEKLHASLRVQRQRQSKRRRRRKSIIVAGRDKTKLKFAKDIGLEPPTPTYRVSQQINSIIGLIDTRKTQALRKQSRRE